MQIRAEEISQIIRKQIEGFDKKVAVTETGTVLEAGDGIARVYGLDAAMAGELLDFGHGGVVGLVLNLEEDNVGVALLGNFEEVKEGDHLLTLEAMKMNTFVMAPKSGKVTDVKTSVGSAVEEGQALIHICG